MNLAKRGLFANNYKFFVGLSLAKLNAALKALPCACAYFVVFDIQI
jgi:hypothetical protein